ncbi:orotate phosphoribosyltransferase [Thermoplasma sp. Kam2015]|uniref:orotate phosphoribosyltransferase n=1 Tax=Thermoplasma sp. Kam2015 TaxID=2094122 RepID=UPI000D917652|nr:orotate phosphoribosyltransferase [Thermoplasma sp. Kam2015]PYB69173.1 orotate phosphoribosyltransferase [Thermoplasma sp. Kam2015]
MVGLEEDLLRVGAIKFGDFVLTSGKRSTYYVDIKEAATDPSLLKNIASEFSTMIRSKKIAGMELGAVPLVVATALQLSVPYIIVRKERSHGTMSLLVGKLEKGEEIDVIEDVVTTGNSVLKAVQTLRENGAIVKRAFCVVDREEGGSELLRENGIELKPIIKISQVRGFRR